MVFANSSYRALTYRSHYTMAYLSYNNKMISLRELQNYAWILFFFFFSWSGEKQVEIETQVSTLPGFVKDVTKLFLPPSAYCLCPGYGLDFKTSENLLKSWNQTFMKYIRKYEERTQGTWKFIGIFDKYLQLYCFAPNIDKFIQFLEIKPYQAS